MGKPIQTKFGTADLTAAALQLDLVIGTDGRDIQDNVELVGCYLKASENITETVTVHLISATGATYTFILSTDSLSGAQEYRFNPGKGTVFVKRGDTIRLACTNGNTTGTVYAMIQYREDD